MCKPSKALNKGLTTTRILYASERPPYPYFLGGAARSAHNLMSIMAQDFNVECLAIGSKDFTHSPWSCPPEEDYSGLGISEVSPDRTIISFCPGYSVQVHENFMSTLPKVIDDFSPDVIWTQLDGVEAIAQVALKKGIRVLLYLRDAEDAPSMIRSLAAAGVCIVCNSEFMAKRVNRITGRVAHVIYPSLEGKFAVTGDPLGYITMINPNPVKGIEIFLEIAARLHKEKFLLVESWTLGQTELLALQKKIADLPNVHFLRRVADIQVIYRQTKLLLVPSVWEEAFGRVVIEAQSCRIPAIVSSRGGLPEALGKGGICVMDYLNIDAWITAIRQVTDDTIAYENFSKRAYEHATDEKFSTHYAARRLLEICNEGSNFQWSFWDKIQAYMNRLSGKKVKR